MASDPDFAAYVQDQLRGAGAVSVRRMFGEYAVYCDGKVVALICDDQFFLKPTDAGRALIARPDLAPPYPGARDHFRIGDALDDAEALVALVRATWAALPLPKPKAPRRAAKPTAKAKAAPARRSRGTPEADR